MRRIRTLTLVITMIFFITALVGCGNSQDSYIVSFETNGGNVIDSISTDGKSQISIPNDPTKNGYDFDGWYWDNDIWVQPLTVDSLVNAPITNDTTVYAKWTESNTVTITFNSNGGSIVDPVSVDRVSTILLPTEPTKAGYDFDGWYWDNNVWTQELIMGHSLMDAPTPNNLTVYAKWVETSMYTIIFDSNGGNSITSIITDGVSTYLFPSDPTKEGYEFDGWYMDEDVWAERLLAETMFDNPNELNEIHLYAKWVEITMYTIIFDSNGGNSITSIITDGVSTYVFPSDPTKEGYSFDGWYMDEDVWADRLLAETMFDNPNELNEIHLYAKWLEIIYTVTLDVNGGYALENNTLELAIGDDYTLPIPGNLESIFFMGWFTAIDGGTKIDLSGQWSIEEDTTLYAIWSPYLRVDDFIYFGSYPQTIKASDVTIVTTTPDSDGYYLGSDGSRYASILSDPKAQDYKFSDDTNVVDGVIYYFKVEPIKWRILEENNGIATIMSMMGIDNLRYDGDSNSYATSEVRAWLNNEFYNTAFIDYHKAIIETTLVDNSAATTSDPFNIYASLDTFDNVFLMSYQDMLNESYGFNSDPGFEDPMRKIFITDYARSKGGVMSTFTMLDYYQKGYLWLRSPNSLYTANFVEYNGWVGNSPYTYDSYEVAPVLRIQLGDITLHTITFDSNDGTVVEPVVIENHSNLNLPTEPTKNNFVFAGWYFDDNTFEDTVEFPYIVNKDITIYAKWTNIYTLTFNSDGGTVIDSLSQSSDTDIYAPTEPIKDGYTFRGWFYEDTFENAVIFPVLLDENTLIYAKWTVTSTEAYVRTDVFGNVNSGGSYLLFGSYPQTLKDSSVLITSSTPDSDGYYLGSDGERYAKVIATPYIDLSNTVYKFGDSSDIITGTVYYFKVEPLKWRILEISNGSALILCEMLIDNHVFDDDSNNYEESQIRVWLNSEFYNTVFNEYQTAIIETTLVDNSISTTIYPETNTYSSNNTLDNVFLLNYLDMKTTAYGFDSDDSIYDAARRHLTTDYARSIGTYIYTDDSTYYGYGSWWLRSPYYLQSDLTSNINYYGSDQFYLNVDSTNMGGIVPALIIIIE